jgi:hypothetical protein
MKFMPHLPVDLLVDVLQVAPVTRQTQTRAPYDIFAMPALMNTLYTSRCMPHLPVDLLVDVLQVAPVTGHIQIRAQHQILCQHHVEVKDQVHAAPASGSAG